MPNAETLQYFKDARLNQLGTFGNVAQFVSFGPDLEQRFSRISGFQPNFRFPKLSQALDNLFRFAPEHRVNIRSFKPEDPQGHEFLYGITSPQAAETEVRRLAGAGLFVIVNETVDVNDGGVSGVAHGGLIEFAPGHTPRIVETGKIVSLDRDVGERLLRSVYGFTPDLPKDPAMRVEFSIHPIRRGFSHEHTIIWELQELPVSRLSTHPAWPNRFSEFLGDKVFGLLLADSVGLRVPRTMVVSRHVAPFTFGDPTGVDVKWIRTCPVTPEPGLFPTVRGWTDPFKLMQEIVGHERIASLMVQDEVFAQASGALLTGRDETPIIEGVIGFGDDFMLGRIGPSQLDSLLVRQIDALHTKLRDFVGSVRAEWAYDGTAIWIIQLQQETAISMGRTIVPGSVESEVEFDVSGGISGLRELVELVRGRSIGIKILGNVGMTSHIADILRRNNVPSRIVQEQES